MKLFLFWLCIFSACSSLNAQEVKVIHQEDLNKWLHDKSDTIYIINFWATWCKPCVEEIPVFEKIHQTNSHKPVKVIMVSSDFKRQLATHLIPFVKSHHLKAEVVYLDEPDAEKWISDVNPEWSGAIPATLIQCEHRKLNQFFEGKLTVAQIQKIIDQYLQ